MLDCMARHDGLGDRAVDAATQLPACDECKQPGANLRCRACLFGRVLCTSCMLSEHQRLPLHRIDVRYLALSVRARETDTVASLALE